MYPEHDEAVTTSVTNGDQRRGVESTLWPSKVLVDNCRYVHRAAWTDGRSVGRYFPKIPAPECRLPQQRHWEVSIGKTASSTGSPPRERHSADVGWRAEAQGRSPPSVVEPFRGFALNSCFQIRLCRTYIRRVSVTNKSTEAQQAKVVRRRVPRKFPNGPPANGRENSSLSGRDPTRCFRKSSWPTNRLRRLIYGRQS